MNLLLFEISLTFGVIRCQRGALKTIGDDDELKRLSLQIEDLRIYQLNRK